MLLDGVARGRYSGPSPEFIRLISSIKWTQLKESPEYDASFIIMVIDVYITLCLYDICYNIIISFIMSKAWSHDQLSLQGSPHKLLPSCICTAITVMIGVPSPPPSGESEAENKKNLTHQLTS